MFKNYFILGLIAGLFSSLVSLAYTKMYASIIVNFSEATSYLYLLSFGLMITMGAAIVNFGLTKVISNLKVADFILNFILSGVSIYFVFHILQQNDPEFKDENAAVMIDYFKGFMMPLAFIPALSYFSFRSLFNK